MIEGQAKWIKFSKDLVTIGKELLLSMENMGQQLTFNQINTMAIKDKMAKSEAFLNSYIEELQTKHGLQV